MKSSSRDHATTTGSALDAREPFRLHEILHTASLALEFFCAHIADREDVMADDELFEASGKPLQALSDFYQLVGRISAAQSSAAQVQVTDPGMPTLPPPPTEGR